MQEKKTNAPFVRKRVLLVAFVAIAATVFYAFYFEASDFQAKGKRRAAEARKIAPGQLDDLVRSFAICPEKLTDDEYVAAALAWEEQLQADLNVEEPPLPEADQYIVYDAMLEEMGDVLLALRPKHPGLSKAIESTLLKAEEDLPID